MGSTCRIDWNKSRHTALWGFSLHCGIENTSCPDIIFNHCHQDHHYPSDHVTSSVGKQFKADAHIVQVNKFTESDVSELTGMTVDETAFAILERQGSHRITEVSSQRKFIFDS